MPFTHKVVIHPKQLQGAVFAALVVVLVLISSGAFSMSGVTVSVSDNGSLLLQQESQLSKSTGVKKLNQDAHLHCNCRMCGKYKSQSVSDFTSGNIDQDIRFASRPSAISFSQSSTHWARPQYYVFLFNYSLF